MQAVQGEYDTYLKGLFVEVERHQIAEQTFFKYHITSPDPFLPLL